MVKKNYKIIIGIVIGIIVSSIGVYAVASLSSSEVTYNNKETGISANNLQGAIDELYEKSNEQKSRMPKPGNENIVKVYFYSQEKESEDFCVTGDEATCKVNTCYLNTSKDSCAPGTIIEYKVKEGEKLRFHVVEDDGETMILQSQKNTVYSTQWYTTNDNTQGPITSLAALENATNDWTNVNTLEYSIGGESDTLKYSGCYTPNSCVHQIYTLTKSRVKARMITAQEANELGCTSGNKSCPIWMYNYFYDSTSNGGTANDSNAGAEYWTMSANAQYGDSVWRISIMGYISGMPVINSYGARAVVEINKNPQK